MEQLIALVAEKAGIDQEQARTAVTTVLGFLKQKLPAGMAGQLDKLASGEGEGGAMGAIEKGIGGLFGR
jgi:hypothetical protein